MKSSAGSSGSTPLSKAIDLHQSGQLQKADKIYARLLAKKATNIDALHMRGVLKLEQGHHELAEHLLKKAISINSNDPWIHYHFAQVLAATNRHQTASIHFTKAIKSGATEADVYYTYANSLFELNNLPEAIDNYQRALQLQPNDTDCSLNLANAYEASGDLESALKHLEPLAQSKHASVSLKLQLAEFLVKTKRAIKAHVVVLQIKDQVTVQDVDHLLSTARYMQKQSCQTSAAYLLHLTQPFIDTHNTQQRDLTVGLSNDLGHYQDSIELLHRALHRIDNKSGRTAWSWFQQGICSQVTGDFDGAAQCHHKALSVDDTLGAAAYSLATNGSTIVDKKLLQDWTKKKDDPAIKPDRQAQFAFAAARVLDQNKEYDRAFSCYLQGNKLISKELPFDIERWDAYTDSLIETFSADFFKQRREYFDSASLANKNSGKQLAFIVGMPRSGSTLLEQTLKQRAGFTGLGEHYAMRRIVADIPELTNFKRSAPQCALDLDKSHLELFRHQYFNSIDPSHSPGSIDRFVDKMLGNFVRLGTLALIFPGARILHSARDPMATGVSCFTNAFNSGLRFTYDLYSMGRAWQSYNRLMQHWHKVLPIKIMDVQYEDMVTDPDNYFDSIMQFMELSELPTKPSVSKTDTIATASFWQARQSISTSSLTSWERFDSYLDPLREGLEYKHHG